MPDRENVIKGLEKCKRHECDNCTEIGASQAPWDCPAYDNFVDSALDLLKEQEWHTLTEDRDGIIHGLPGDDGQYLMTDGKDIWIDDYVDGVADGIILDSGRDIREITAWMYMPELPKKDTMML